MSGMQPDLEENVLKLETGAIYEGCLFNGMRQGQGKQTWPDGSYYIGEFYNDKAHGSGKLVI